ncbi:MAG TPA: lipoprotein-releasing ABC transporter permease subunit [Phenylobacterium sp.]|jgi:lipoprotein-releasing system permease protein|uniref:lipoprotein-releasing ABC transporter permease subunit n=1 Tax=Phenylobacterium sp. TaxID=1871053 RepID=UPI002C519851|nr:lipoprotein-releasing ABC transporter permease subunit [Phenylobacterium sp.]HXA38585.1 lipoprotein-releasing ABC transporter permease subunit [Phenylobacterium sp.]
MSELASTRAAPFGLWERMLAGRYLRAKRSEGGVALISIISFTGVTLAVAILIIVMSVMNGFRAELLGKILGFNGHVFVTGGLLDNARMRDAAVEKIAKVPGVTQAFPVIDAQAIALGPSQVTGAMVRGLSPKDLAATRIVAGNLTSGDIKGFGQGPYGGDMVVVGARLADQLGVRPGDNITLISPSGGATAFGGTPLQKAYVVGATFTAGMSQYDQAYIFMPLEQAQLFFGREGTVDAIEIRVADPDKAPALKAAIGRAAGPTALVADWTQRDASYWGALKVERNVMRLILMMLVVIAAMNIISGLVMLVKNKGRDIAILRTIGAGQGSIMRIFFMAGAAIGAAGTLAGLALGVLISVYIDPIQSFVEWATGQQVFASDVYFLSRLPAKVDWVEVAVIVAFSLVMSMVWTLPPAWRASRLDPVEALRYE